MSKVTKQNSGNSGADAIALETGNVEVVSSRVKMRLSQYTS